MNLSYIFNNWMPIIAIVGVALQVLGAVLMARRFLNVILSEMVIILCVAIYRGEMAKNSVQIANVTGEKALTFVQGLSFLIFGTLFQLPLLLRELV